jgi:hypothetical protein
MHDVFPSFADNGRGRPGADSLAIKTGVDDRAP